MTPPLSILDHRDADDAAILQRAIPESLVNIAHDNKLSHEPRLIFRNLVAFPSTRPL